MQALYGVGFLLACIYHVCHMDEAGLIASRVMGLSGAFWRSADVYMVQWLLGRMWGHALNATHPVTAGTIHPPAWAPTRVGMAIMVHSTVSLGRMWGHLTLVSCPVTTGLVARPRGVGLYEQDLHVHMLQCWVRP